MQKALLEMHKVVAEQTQLLNDPYQTNETLFENARAVFQSVFRFLLIAGDMKNTSYSAQDIIEAMSVRGTSASAIPLGKDRIETHLLVINRAASLAVASIDYTKGVLSSFVWSDSFVRRMFSRDLKYAVEALGLLGALPERYGHSHLEYLEVALEAEAS